MKTSFYLRFLLVALSCLGISSLSAQDIHFSQFYNSPLTLNPALTGVGKADLRVTGIYRSQWNAANAPYKTFLVSGENRFYNISHDTWWFSGGLALFHDRAGDGDFATTSLVLSGSYTKMLGTENFLTVGLSAGVGQRVFEMQDLTFDNQWNGDVFDPNRPTKENFADDNIRYPDFGAGFNWRGQKEKTRSKVDVGAAALHFSRPNQSWQGNDKSQLPVRLSMYFMPTVQVTSKLDIVGNGTAQVQGKYLEALATGAARYYLSTKKSQEIAVQFGVGYRFNANGDAFITAGELHYHSIMVGLSWDVNVSDFSVATNRNGGPEISFRYLFYKVQPLKAFKACPMI